MGLSPGLVRISVGYTGNLDQRVAQLEAGVRAAANSRSEGTDGAPA